MTFRELIDYARFGCAIAPMEDSDYEDIKDFAKEHYDVIDVDIDNLKIKGQGN